MKRWKITRWSFSGFQDSSECSAYGPGPAAIGSDTEDNPGGMGASLVQFGDEESPHPVGYVSRAPSKHEKNYSAYLLELAACVYGIEKFRI